MVVKPVKSRVVSIFFMPFVACCIFSPLEVDVVESNEKDYKYTIPRTLKNTYKEFDSLLGIRILTKKVLKFLEFATN